jgi:hypothetical protein
MERTIQQLEEAQARLRGLLVEHPSAAAEVLARCVPHLVGLIEERVPAAHAVILRRDDVRELCLGLVVDMLEAQARAARPAGSRRASALP